MVEGVKGFRVGFSKSGDTWNMTDIFGESKTVNKFKIDEEFQYINPGTFDNITLDRFVEIFTFFYFSKNRFSRNGPYCNSEERWTK